jgi:Cu2+-containing amine oxidase
MIRWLILFAAAALAALAAAPASAQTCRRGATAVEQSFPSTGPEQTKWFICVSEATGGTRPNGLVVGPVYFRKAPTAPFVKIFYDARVAEIFVPYELGLQRYFDLSYYKFSLGDLSAAECPASAKGILITPRICRELRDRGLIWKDQSSARRGEDLAIWGVIFAANYRYVERFEFRDDGTIIGRIAATGQNISNSPYEMHAHNAVWRLDIDLNGIRNKPALVRRVEDVAGPLASTEVTPIAKEGPFPYSAQEFTTLSIGNANLTNKAGHASTYRLMMITEGGSSRHMEPFTQSEYWVSRYHPDQYYPGELPQFVADGAPTANNDVVFWVKGSAHHDPRDEDGVISQGQWIGVTHTMGAGFMLMPHNLFDCSPLYEPCP